MFVAVLESMHLPTLTDATDFTLHAFACAVRDGGPNGPNVYVGKSEIPGAERGVFARRAIARGAWITTYHGVVLPSHLIPSDGRPYSIDYPVRSPEHGLDQSLIGTRYPKPDEGVAQLVNDSIHPKVTGMHHNCDLFFHRPKLTWVLVASRDLAAHEELFVSYGWGYWRGQWRRAVASLAVGSELPAHLAWIGRTAVPVDYLSRAGLPTDFTEDIDIVYHDDLRVNFRCHVRVLARCHLPICTHESPLLTHPDRRTYLEVDFVRRSRVASATRGSHEEILRVRCVRCNRPFARFTHS